MYDERLAERIRQIIGPDPDVSERKMFGGIAFLQGGKMFCGLAGDDLMVRVGRERHEEALARAHVRPMDFTGRPMVGYVFVAPAGCKNRSALAAWVSWARDVVRALPPEKPRKRAVRPAKFPRRIKR
jgi:TfoX/Sxy family transcriptional regulator of competence genes